MLAGRKNNIKIIERILDAYSIKGIIDLVIEWRNTGQCISIEYINAWFKKYKAYLYIKNAYGRTVMDIPLISEILLARATVDINVIVKHINISLREALIKGYLRIVVILCKYFRINSFNEIKDAIEISKIRNYTEIVKFLEKIEIIMKKWFSAVRSNNSILCNRIINNYDININIKDSTGKTALDIALKMGHLGIVNLILERVENIQKIELSFRMYSLDDLENYWDNLRFNYFGKYSFDELDKPDISRYPKVLELFLYHYNFYMPVTKSLIESVVKNNNVEGINILMKNDDKINRDITYDEIKKVALTAAFRYNCFDIITYFIEKGVDSKEIVAAANNGHIDELNMKLMIAAKRGYIEIVKILVENGTGIDFNIINKELLEAAKIGEIDIVRSLVGNGVRINVKNEALMVALKKNHFNIVKILVENGVGIDAINKALISVATKTGHTEMAKILIDNGAGIDAINKALVVAASKGHTSMVKLLLKSNVNIDFINEALMSAVKREKISTIECLKERINNITKEE